MRASRFKTGDTVKRYRGAGTYKIVKVFLGQFVVSHLLMDSGGNLAWETEENLETAV